MAHSRMKLLGALVACGCILGLNGGNAAWAAEFKDDYENQLSTNQAARDLQREEMAIQARNQQEDQAAAVRAMVVDVKDVKFAPNNSLSESQLRFLLPELSKSQVRVYELSQQIQIANDSCGARINADFRPAAGGGFEVYVTSQKLKQAYGSITVTNGGTGNDAGDWRSTFSYVKKNLTGSGDTMGVAITTAPGRWDNVKQGAVSYKWLLPHAKDSMTFSASYSDVDMGNVLNPELPFSMNVSGKGKSVGLHYQHNMRYTARAKDWWDIGFDYRKYENDYSVAWDYGIFRGSDDLRYPDYDLKLLSATYVHTERQDNQALVWHAGITTNLGGISQEYRDRVGNCDSHFNILKAGLNYQYRTNENWIVGLRASGQYTNNKLVGSQRFGLGGMDSIRGFNSNVVNGDKGVMGSLEIMTPELCKHTRAYVFTDMGAISSNSQRVGSKNLASAGVGLRFSDPVNSWYVDLSYAGILQDLDKNTDKYNAYKRWNLMVTKTF